MTNSLRGASASPRTDRGAPLASCTLDVSLTEIGSVHEVAVKFENSSPLVAGIIQRTLLRVIVCGYLVGYRYFSFRGILDQRIFALLTSGYFSPPAAAKNPETARPLASTRVHVVKRLAVYFS